MWPLSAVYEAKTVRKSWKKGEFITWTAAKTVKEGQQIARTQEQTK